MITCVFPPFKSVFGPRVATAPSLGGPWVEEDIAIGGNGGDNQEHSIA